MNCQLRMLFRTFSRVAAGLLICGAAAQLLAGPATQFGLYNTGVGDDQLPLLDNDVDPHYELIDPSLIVGDAYAATEANGWPVGGGVWLGDNNLSTWIVPTLDTNAPGDDFEIDNYVFRTTFDLTGVNLDALEIVGRWSSDNTGVDIVLNDTPLGIRNDGGFTALTPFTLNDFFEQGINTLDFLVYNANGNPNPAGVRVEFEGNGFPGTRHPNAIPSLYNTGVDDFDVALFGGQVLDSHYTIAIGPDGEPLDAFTLESDGWPVGGAWRADSLASRWIGPEDVLGGNDANGEPGTYLYETKFDMTGLDPQNFSIVGNWGTDNDGPAILVNGVQVPGENLRGFGADPTWFGINADSVREAGGEILPGENSLIFQVDNAPGDPPAANPTGLRVDGLVARAAPAGSSAIPGLFNTGVDDDGVPLPDLEPDPHYTMTVFPDDAVDPDVALAGIPGTWVNNTGSSKWIGPDSDPNLHPPGDYEFEIEFDLTDLDPSTAVILGEWTSDNIGSDILLNGEPTGNGQGGAFNSLVEFEISAAEGDVFLEGVNTLTFLFNNAPGADPPENPAGLRVEGLVAWAMSSGGLTGDYNNNGELDAGDLDLQAEQIVAVPGDPAFDLNGDNVVDFKDRQVWINDLAITWMGDANLNCVFDSSDQVQKFVQGKYEKEVVAGWADGDSNGDMRFNSSDMVADFVSGGYEKVAKPGCVLEPPVNAAVGAVPEPSTWALALLAALGCLGGRRRRI